MKKRIVSFPYERKRENDVNVSPPMLRAVKVVAVLIVITLCCSQIIYKNSLAYSWNMLAGYENGTPITREMIDGGKHFEKEEGILFIINLGLCILEGLMLGYIFKSAKKDTIISMMIVASGFVASTLIIYSLDKTPAGFANYYVNPMLLFAGMLLGFVLGLNTRRRINKI